MSDVWIDTAEPPLGRQDGERSGSMASLCVSGILLRVLADVVAQYDVRAETLLQGEPQRFDLCEPVEVRLHLAQFLGLVHRAVELTGDEALGLRCGLHASQSAFDLMAPLVSHVPTLRDAIYVARRFQSLALDGARMELTERAGVARLRCDFPRLDEGSDRWLAEFMTAGLLRMLRAFGCDRDSLHAAYFEYRRPARSHAYAAAFQGVERFSAGFTGLEFAASLLDRPNLHANPVLQKLVHAQAEQNLARLGRPTTVADQLRVYLLSRPPDRTPDMHQAARDLGLSVRSLRRRLREAGLTYRTVTQDILHERACAMLHDPNLTLQAVAGALGFLDVSAFHRAFKRWTGVTPSEYRRALA